jgi:subtilisin family serine protease
MTTDGTSSTPEPARPPEAAIHPEEDYPDTRNDAQRQADGDIGDEQSEALTDVGPDPHSRIDGIIDSIRQNRLGIAGLGLPHPPIQFDVLHPPGQPDQPNLGDMILVVRGELLLRVPAGGAPGPGEGPGARGADDEQPTWQQAHTLLLERGYQQVSADFPPGLPLLRYLSPGRAAADLLADRDLVRDRTGAEVDLNYCVTAGHLVKADDYPRATAAYPPEWIRHRVTREVTVAVIDTGINHELRTDGWLTGIPQGAANVDPLDVFPVTVVNGHIHRGDRLLDLSAGHGTFVTGCLQQVAPESTIVVYRAVDTEGMGTSYDVAQAIIRAAEDGADIIHMSLGTMTVDNLPPLPFILAMDTAVKARPHLLVVASAGNTGLDTPMFPAAMKGVVGVGALAADLTPAPWSNHGFWLTCSAVGVGITSTFVRGDERHTDATGGVVTQHFGHNAWAIWSGTSFSAPQIAGAVARLCQLNDVLPAVALGQLLAGRRTLPGYGVVVPILPGS